MSVSTLFNGRNYIDQPIIKSDTLLNKKTTFELNNNKISSYIDNTGHHLLNENTGIKLLSFSHSDTLNDCLLKQHITDNIYNSQLGQIPISTILRCNNNAQNLSISNLSSVQARDFILTDDTLSIKDTINSHDGRLTTLENVNNVQLNQQYSQEIATLQQQNAQLNAYITKLKSFFSLFGNAIQISTGNNTYYDFSNLQ